MDAAVALQKENERQLQKEDERQSTDHRAENEWRKELEADNNVLRKEIAEYKEKIINDAAVMKDLERLVCFKLFTQEQNVYRIFLVISRNRSTLCYCTTQDHSLQFEDRRLGLSACLSAFLCSKILDGVNSLPVGTTAVTPSLMSFGK